MAMVPTSFRSYQLLVATTLGLAALLAVPLCAQTAQPPLAGNRIAAIDESTRVTLKGTVHPLANAANDRGAAPDSMPLQRLHLVLRRSPAQEAALRQLVRDMHTPGSASYHKWLTPEQFGEQFGPSDQDIATVQSWLGSHGFEVGKVQPGKQVIEFSGNVAQMRDAFHTQIHKYVVNGETHHANAGAPQIPSALAPVVGGFVSLNNFRPKHYIRVLGQATYNTQTHTAKPQWTYGNSSPPTFVLAPADYAKQYDLSPLYAAGINGSNQTIAIVNDSNINIDLVNQFRSSITTPISAVPPLLPSPAAAAEPVACIRSPRGKPAPAFLPTGSGISPTSRSMRPTEPTSATFPSAHPMATASLLRGAISSRLPASAAPPLQRRPSRASWRSSIKSMDARARRTSCCIR